MRCTAAALLLLVVTLVAATSTGELSALSDVYYACNGASWLDNSNWVVGDPCANTNFTWYGISCESDQVVGLYLSSNDLQGTLPSTMENLYNATNFVLNDNAISGSIPENLSAVRSLVKVDLHRNVLSGSIPDSLGELLDYNLDYLDLSDNQLTGAIPAFFGGAENEFGYVDLSGNPFDCPIPTWANYTGATCTVTQLTLKTTQPLCVGNALPFLVFGSNFLSLGELQCTLLDEITGEEISSTPAMVIGDDTLQCIAKYPFNACNGTGQWSYLYAHSHLVLTHQGQVVTANSVSLGVTNHLCPLGTTFYDSNGVVWDLPTDEHLLEVCTVATSPMPWSCPSYIAQPTGGPEAVPLVFDPFCSASANTTTCVWAPTVGHVCPLFQCYGNYGCINVSACQTGSLSGATCFTNVPDCYDTC